MKFKNLCCPRCERGLTDSEIPASLPDTEKKIFITTLCEKCQDDLKREKKFAVIGAAESPNGKPSFLATGYAEFPDSMWKELFSSKMPPDRIACIRPSTFMALALYVQANMAGTHVNLN